MTHGRHAAIHVREAQAGDAAALAELFAQLGYATTGDEVVCRLRDRGARALVAEDAGSVVGAASLALVSSPVQGRWCRMTALVVDEGARSQGVGALLVREVERLAAATGCFAVEVTSSPHRAGAHRFYRRLGYEERPARFLKSLRQ